MHGPEEHPSKQVPYIASKSNHPLRFHLPFPFRFRVSHGITEHSKRKDPDTVEYGFTNQGLHARDARRALTLPIVITTPDYHVLHAP
eukprot:7391792-Prymnesium_polylepis.2